ncbi:MAG TPA: hypothetical protein DDW78_06365, partial [Treponema sp.]|nr:hypothetical protein [Treponema sp.]
FSMKTKMRSQRKGHLVPAEKHPDCLLHASLCKWQPGRFSASAHFLCWILGFCSIKKKIILKQFT